MTLEKAEDNLKRALVRDLDFTEEGALRMIEIIKECALQSSVTKVKKE